MNNRVQLENKIAELTRANYPETGIEYLVGLLSSLCTENQLKVLTNAINSKAEVA